MTQRIKVNEDNRFNLAKKYYELLFLLNNISLSGREVQLITFISLNGNLYEKGMKEKFCSDFNASTNTIYNMIRRIVNLGILQQSSRKSLTISESLHQFDFNQPLNLLITIGNKEWIEEKLPNTTSPQ